MASAEPVMLPEPIGARMKRARREAGIKIEFMAEHFNMSVPAVRSWEQGLHKPHHLWDVLEEWARLTNVSYTWLLTGGGRLVTKGVNEYNPLIVIEGQQRLDLELPPSKTEPALTLITGGGLTGGDD